MSTSGDGYIEEVVDGYDTLRYGLPEGHRLQMTIFPAIDLIEANATLSVALMVERIS